MFVYNKKKFFMIRSGEVSIKGKGYNSVEDTQDNSLSSNVIYILQCMWVMGKISLRGPQKITQLICIH
jgi:hypothetical protein